MLSTWFETLRNSLPTNADGKVALRSHLKALSEHRAPSLVYFLILFHLFKDLGDELDEERIVKSATVIRNTNVWKKLYKFQRDGVVGAIDKRERHGGCIIADSVGLGKTFEALAIIKYYELRNDRVLVLVPKRLRDNWTLYKANDRRNILAADRFNYDVLNHTDLSRDGGISGDIDLSHVNWGNYDLVVIDESHNFRNKATHKDRETRYDRLMRQIIKEGVTTRVLMLSATPANNRLADLRNQIAFVTEGEDTALAGQGISSVESTVRKAQLQFNRWLNLEEIERKPARLMDMLGFDYFKLLDLLTIARSRKYIEKYYGTAETGTFPDRLKPINIKSDVDRAGEFRAIREINNEIRRWNLSAYAPLRYVLPGKQAAYDAKYSTKIRGGESVFRQADREERPIAIACGNTFVLKASEKVPSCSMRMAELFAEAGLPEGVLNVVNGDKEAVDALLTHSDVQAISFVGSTPVARHVYETGSHAGKRVQALGGAKNHAVVLPDADLSFTTKALIGAAYGSAGERCMAISVVAAVGKVGDALVDRLRREAAALRIGPGDGKAVDIGPLVSAVHRNSGVGEGATLLLDGRDVAIPGHAGGFFVGPTLFDQVTPNMKIYREESFGPVLRVVRAATLTDAIRMVNPVPYANGTAIFTGSGAAAQRFQNEIQVGMVGVNVPIPVPMAFFSFGGWKNSLFGDLHVHGADGVRFYTRGKVVTNQLGQAIALVH